MSLPRREEGARCFDCRRNAIASRLVPETGPSCEHDRVADRLGRDDGLAERLRRPNCLVATLFCRRQRASADHRNGNGSQPRMASRTRRTCARAAPILKR